jgi:hypothetical protein
VTLDISSTGLCFDETHVYADRDNPITPPDKGAPGRFPFKHEDLSANECIQTDPYVITDFDLVCDEIASLAAHAVVCEPSTEADWGQLLDLVDRSAGMSGQVMTRVSLHDNGTSLDVEILDGGGLSGVHAGWFADLDRKMSLRTVYFAEIVSTLSIGHDGSIVPNPSAAKLIEYPDNLSSVNWVINQGFPGRNSTCGGTFTDGDVQRAIWELLEDDQPTDGLQTWDQCRVNEIVAAATQQGYGYIPGCDDSVAVILNPVGHRGENIARIAIAEIDLGTTSIGCQRRSPGDCETAWAQSLGGDIPFPRGGGWGSYFEYLCE